MANNGFKGLLALMVTGLLVTAPRAMATSQCLEYQQIVTTPGLVPFFPVNHYIVITVLRNFSKTLDDEMAFAETGTDLEIHAALTCHMEDNNPALHECTLEDDSGQFRLRYIPATQDTPATMNLEADGRIVALKSPRVSDLRIAVLPERGPGLSLALARVLPREECKRKFPESKPMPDPLRDEQNNQPEK